MRRSHDWTLCRSGLFDVAEHSQCSADGRREVVETILMFTWGTQVRPPGSRGRRHSFGLQEVDEVVDQGASSRIKTLPKNHP